MGYFYQFIQTQLLHCDQAVVKQMSERCHPLPQMWAVLMSMRGIALIYAFDQEQHLMM
jgi:hypothetical protein